MISKFDVTMIVCMSLAIVSMSFVFPTLGLGGSEQTQSDIPNMSIDTGAFGIERDRPEYPGSPSHGVLNHSSSKFDDYRGSIQVELGDSGVTDDRIFLVAINETAVHIVNASEVLDVHNYTANGTTTQLSGGGYAIDVHSRDISVGEYEWQVNDRPRDTAWYSSIPLVGGLFSAGADVAGGIMWIGATLIWASTAVVLGAINVLNIVVQTMAYFLELGMWLITTYTSIVNAPSASWVKVFLSIPGVILGVMLGKLAVVGIRTVPFT